MDDTETTRARPGRTVSVDPGKLREARLAAGLNTADAAARARIGRQWWSAIENGKGSPSLDTLMRMAAAVKVRHSKLLAAKAAA
jgi:transcriptional regulator with XRE-family HTH domain